MTGDDDDFSGFGLLELAHELDALAIGESQIGQQYGWILPAKLDAGLAQRMRAGDGEALHSRDFLQPVHDVRIVVDYQRMCHITPLRRLVSDINA